jgi:hypothetical protein
MYLTAIKIDRCRFHSASLHEMGNGCANRGICCGQSDTGTNSSASTSVLPVSTIPPALRTHSIRR